MHSHMLELGCGVRTQNDGPGVGLCPLALSPFLPFKPGNSRLFSSSSPKGKGMMGKDGQRSPSLSLSLSSFRTELRRYGVPHQSLASFCLKRIKNWILKNIYFLESFSGVSASGQAQTPTLINLLIMESTSSSVLSTPRAKEPF